MWRKRKYGRDRKNEKRGVGWGEREREGFPQCYWRTTSNPAPHVLLRILGVHVHHTPTLGLLFTATITISGPEYSQLAGHSFTLSSPKREYPCCGSGAQESLCVPRNMSGRARVRARGIAPSHGTREEGRAPGYLTVSVFPSLPCPAPQGFPVHASLL